MCSWVTGAQGIPLVGFPSLHPKRKWRSSPHEVWLRAWPHVLLLDVLRLVPAAPPARGTLENEAGDQGSSREMRASGRGSSVWSGPPRSREILAEDESCRPSEAGDRGQACPDGLPTPSACCMEAPGGLQNLVYQGIFRDGFKLL